MKTTYDAEDDVLDIELKKGDYWKSIELPNGVVIDIAKDKTIMGIEILKASKVFSGDVKQVIDGAQKAVSAELKLTEKKINPEYLKKLERIEKGKFYSFKSKVEFLEFLEKI